MSGHFGEANDYVSGQIKPRNDNVLVRMLPPPSEFKSSLIVEPDREYRKVDAAWADVVAVGDPRQSYRRHCNKCHRPYDKWHDDLRAGDRVLLEDPQAGDVVVVSGVEHRIVRMAEIAAVVEP